MSEWNGPDSSGHVVYLERKLYELASPLRHEGLGLQLPLAVGPITRNGAKECREGLQGALHPLLSQVAAGLKVNSVQRLSGQGLQNADRLLEIWLLGNLIQECQLSETV